MGWYKEFLKGLIFQTAVFIEIHFQFTQDKMTLSMKFNNPSAIEVYYPEGFISVNSSKIDISPIWLKAEI